MPSTEAELFSELYFRLFNRVTGVMLELQDAQRETEELFLMFETEQEKKMNTL